MRSRIEKFYIWCGIGREESLCFSWFTIIILLGILLIRVVCGAVDANKEGKCVARSVGDILMSPAYILGCNLTKDRFNIPLN